MTVPFSIAALHAELVTDPAGLGYVLDSGDQNALADLLNVWRPGGSYQVDRDPVTVSQVFSVVAPDDFAALTSTQLAQLQTIFTLPTVNLAVGNVRDNLAGIFGTNSVTQQAILALQKREGSRAEALWGKGAFVTVNEIDQALHFGG